MIEFIPNTKEDQRRMLAEIGLKDIEELFADIPKAVLERYEPLGLAPVSELEIKSEMAAIARQNLNPEEYVSFLGGGIYDHFIPSVVGHLISRSEFLTSYTPYQAELSQGTLTWMFEFQTMICELTGMDVANSSMYDGGSALAEAMLMARSVTGRKRFLIAKSVNPHYQQVVRTYAWGAGLELTEVPFNEDGRIDKAFVKKHSADLGGVLVQTPNFFGIIEDLSEVKEMIKEGFLIVSVNPISLGILKPPGEFGADIVVGEGQPLGNPMNFGGPLLGLFATKKEHMRKMPGRISGRTCDLDGKTGYVMALQTREQHIRRERATSNICTNQALLALAATIYLAALGKQGLRRLAELNLQKAHYLSERITELDGYALRFPEVPFFNEFLVQTKQKPPKIIETLRRHKVLAGLDTSHILENTLLVAVTEKRAKVEMDTFVKLLKEV